MPSSDAGDDFVGVGGPRDGLGLVGMLVEKVVDGGLKVGDRAENAALQSAIRALCEEALDGVEP